ERYAEIARFLGLPAATTEEGVTSLIQAIRNLNGEFGIPLSLQETGISREEFQREVVEMADIAFNDQCTGANPRMPLVAEIEELYLQAYEGKGLSVQKQAC
ncbi:MAG TPA: bifunctional acetaldehyde-CoA/alcohol dehydrogenase, partial [Firmicutes bacterium]|nr:bifunctional acetaldehyde-CoA/alcohol dehydrogenase [Bacillota bacterium]